ncbi:MAG: lipoxygenase family protein [Cyanobacteria bacterium P01_G01_bin.54]
MSEDQKYEYDYNTNFAPLAMLKGVLPPLEHIAGREWLLKVAVQLTRVFINGLANEAKSLEDEGIQEVVQAVRVLYDSDNLQPSRYTRDTIERIIKSLDVEAEKSPAHTLFEKIMREIANDDLDVEDVLNLADSLFNTSEKSSSNDRPTTLKGYEEQFKKVFRIIPIVPLPKISQNFKDDLQFANMRVAGPNPLVIERMTTEDPRFPVTNEQYQAAMETADSIQQALSDGRLYLADYGLFEDALQGTYPQEQKYICAPLALFAVPEKGHKNHPYLCPIAIQCFPEPGEDNPIFTPKDGNWLIAKTIVQIADANFHEAISHLGRTHLVIEPFVIATYRTLPENHLLRKLLLPHFEGTFLINWGANNILASNKGGVDELLAQTIDASRVVAVKGAQSYLFDFNGSMLKETLKHRGVDDPGKLPYYPYRDDALKIWGVIKEWVTGYLESYYTSNDQIGDDIALQSWVKELLSYEGGRLKNFGEEGQIRTLDYLIEATTMIIFTASAQHAAVNFPQSKIMSYTPAMPLAGYSLAPTTTAGSSSDQDLIQLLPTLDIALAQLNLTYLLGSVYYTKLGYYSQDFKNDLNESQKTALSDFQTNLEYIEGEIEKRNKKNSDVTYEYLIPSQIPQSINI